MATPQLPESAGGVLTAPRTHQTEPDWQLTSGDVQQGSILWLGTYKETIASFARHGDHGLFPVRDVTRQKPATPEMYKRPIVVLARTSEHPNSMLFTYVCQPTGCIVSHS